MPSMPGLDRRGVAGAGGLYHGGFRWHLLCTQQGTPARPVGVFGGFPDAGFLDSCTQEGLGCGCIEQ